LPRGILHQQLKSELELRPFDHHQEDWSDGHLFITVITYQVAQILRQTLRQQWQWPLIAGDILGATIGDRLYCVQQSCADRSILAQGIKESESQIFGRRHGLMLPVRKETGKGTIELVLGHTEMDGK
jgi:hypothetical protein